VQREGDPPQRNAELSFQSFSTPGNEVAPGSDEIRKDFQNGIFSF
jgi:hypothetical protein